MSIFLTYPNGEEEIVDLEKFNPDNYSEWNINIPDLYDGITIKLNFSRDKLMKIHTKRFTDIGMKTYEDIFMYKTENEDLLFSKKFVLGNIPDLELDLSYQESLTSLSDCTQNINWLNLKGCKSLVSLEGCPQNLRWLNLKACKSLVSLEGCPQNLRYINLEYCESLTSLKGCPQNLEKLDLTGCESLTSLEGCPQELTGLCLMNCVSLVSLEGCPQNLRWLNLEGCPPILTKLCSEYIQSPTM